jgi:hypothetical protein
MDAIKPSVINDWARKLMISKAWKGTIKMRGDAAKAKKLRKKRA